MASRIREIQAAGVVVFRAGWDVLLVHRPKYDDWAFPKGKLDRGEPAAAAAVREVEEETGLRVRLMRPLRQQRYPVRGGRKRVVYWTGRVRPGAADDVETYVREGEIDHVAWLPVDVAAKQLTYGYDRTTLREALRARKRTGTIIVLRHAESWSRRAWRRGEDRVRPLVVAGRRQAADLIPLLDAYDVTRVVSSSSARCAETVAPYAAERGLVVEETPLLSEEDATRAQVRRLVKSLRHGVTSGGGQGPTLVCSHRPVLPWIFEALGVPDPGLEKGELLVVHLRKGTAAATERHRV